MTDMTFDLLNAQPHRLLDAPHNLHPRLTAEPKAIVPNTADPSPAAPRTIGRIPRITIQAFCDSPEVATAIELAGADRLMSRARVSVQLGGIAAAIECYREAPTPNLILVESRSAETAFMAEIDRLAEVCDSGTKVMAIGHTNNIAFYRELMRRGISEYVLAPIQPVDLIAAIGELYGEAAPGKLGQVYAFIAARGGAGSSTVAHNVAWSLARRSSLDVIVADMDLPFGTAALDFNVDAPMGIAEALQDPGRLDEVLLDRLLTKCGEHLSLLASSSTLGGSYDPDESTIERLIEVAQASVPFLVLDMPHQWSAWTRNTLRTADEIIITAAPDLASLKNAKGLVDFVKQARPNDPPPRLILNQVGMPKRPEIKPQAFVEALQLEPAACIPFDAHLFGKAANNGQMVAEISAKAAAAKAFTGLADVLADRHAMKGNRKARASLASWLQKLRG